MTRPPMETPLILTLPNGVVIDGKYSTLNAVRGTNVDYEPANKPLFFYRTEGEWVVCNPKSCRLMSELADVEGVF